MNLFCFIIAENIFKENDLYSFSSHLQNIEILTILKAKLDGVNKSRSSMPKSVSDPETLNHDPNKQLPAPDRKVESVDKELVIEREGTDKGKCSCYSFC